MIVVLKRRCNDQPSFETNPMEKIEPALIDWFVATDSFDAVRKIRFDSDPTLAAWFYRHDFLAPGRYKVETQVAHQDQFYYLILVS